MLVILSGYGPNQLIMGGGYGNSAGVSGFFVDSVELPASNTLRVRFTRAPSLGTGPTAGADLANYTLSAGLPVPLAASEFSGDSEVIDIALASDVVPGSYTVTVASTVLSADVFALRAPYIVPFVVAEVNDGPISLGAVNNPTTQNAAANV